MDSPKGMYSIIRRLFCNAIRFSVKVPPEENLPRLTSSSRVKPMRFVASVVTMRCSSFGLENWEVNSRSNSSLSGALVS